MVSDVANSKYQSLFFILFRKRVIQKTCEAGARKVSVKQDLPRWTVRRLFYHPTTLCKALPPLHGTNYTMATKRLETRDTPSQ